jgi:DNA repair protein RecO (recombination protein O)
MEWHDDALVIGVKRHGETSVILEAMTAEHGRHLGLVKGGRSRRMQPMLQVGNSARLVWRARLDEHLGLFAVEPTVLRTARLLASEEALHAMSHVAGLLRLLAERDPHRALYAAASRIADHLDHDDLGSNRSKIMNVIDSRDLERYAGGKPVSPFPHPALAELVVRFEAKLLAETGFGLDLACCAATGTTEDLVYVSPRSGRAVSGEAGAPYKARLLPLPAFLLGQSEPTGPPPDDIRAGFRLTGFFLERDIFGPRGMALPPARGAFLAALGKRHVAAIA